MSDPSDRERIGEGRGEAGERAADAAFHSVLDMPHFERQVQGDEELRDELLRLYASRLQVLGPKLAEAAGPELRETAHALKGASLAVGAFALAELCGVLDAGQEADRRSLARVLEATRLRIEELLREARR